MREKCAAQVHNTTSPARVGSTEECLAFSNDVLNIWSLESTFPCIFLQQLSRKFLSMFCYHNDLCYFTITLSWVKVCGAVSVTERQIFPGIWTLKPRWPGRTFFDTITSLLQHSGQNGITFTRYMHFHSRRMRINSVSKVTRFNEAMIVYERCNFGHVWHHILILSVLNSTPVDQAEFPIWTDSKIRPSYWARPVFGLISRGPNRYSEDQMHQVMSYRSLTLS